MSYNVDDELYQLTSTSPLADKYMANDPDASQHLLVSSRPHHEPTNLTSNNTSNNYTPNTAVTGAPRHAPMAAADVKSLVILPQHRPQPKKSPLPAVRLSRGSTGSTPQPRSVSRPEQDSQPKSQPRSQPKSQPHSQTTRTSAKLETSARRWEPQPSAPTSAPPPRETSTERDISALNCVSPSTNDDNSPSNVFADIEMSDEDCAISAMRPSDLLGTGASKMAARPVVGDDEVDEQNEPIPRSVYPNRTTSTTASRRQSGANDTGTRSHRLTAADPRRRSGNGDEIPSFSAVKCARTGESSASTRRPTQEFGPHTPVSEIKRRNHEASAQRQRQAAPSPPSSVPRVRVESIPAPSAVSSTPAPAPVANQHVVAAHAADEPVPHTTVRVQESPAVVYPTSSVTSHRRPSGGSVTAQGNTTNNNNTTLSSSRRGSAPKQQAPSWYDRSIEPLEVASEEDEVPQAHATWHKESDNRHASLSASANRTSNQRRTSADYDYPAYNTPSKVVDADVTPPSHHMPRPTALHDEDEYEHFPQPSGLNADHSPNPAPRPTTVSSASRTSYTPQKVQPSPIAPSLVSPTHSLGQPRQGVNPMTTNVPPTASSTITERANLNNRTVMHNRDDDVKEGSRRPVGESTERRYGGQPANSTYFPKEKARCGC